MIFEKTEIIRMKTVYLLSMKLNAWDTSNKIINLIVQTSNSVKIMA